MLALTHPRQLPLEKGDTAGLVARGLQVCEHAADERELWALNGKRGIVRSHDESSGMASVYVSDRGVVKVPVVNLKLVLPPPPPGSAPAIVDADAAEYVEGPTIRVDEKGEEPAGLDDIDE